MNSFCRKKLTSSCFFSNSMFKLFTTSLRVTKSPFIIVISFCNCSMEVVVLKRLRVTISIESTLVLINESRLSAVSSMFQIGFNLLLSCSDCLRSNSQASFDNLINSYTCC
uniref:Secreted protein n=1 Tax=Schistosoma curassoni TaxID=6186 RepID=A0A183KN33_9TREM